LPVTDNSFACKRCWRIFRHGARRGHRSSYHPSTHIQYFRKFLIVHGGRSAADSAAGLSELRWSKGLRTFDSLLRHGPLSIESNVGLPKTSQAPTRLKIFLPGEQLFLNFPRLSILETTSASAEA